MIVIPNIRSQFSSEFATPRPNDPSWSNTVLGGMIRDGVRDLRSRRSMTPEESVVVLKGQMEQLQKFLARNKADSRAMRPLREMQAVLKDLERRTPGKENPKGFFTNALERELDRITKDVTKKGAIKVATKIHDIQTGGEQAVPSALASLVEHAKNIADIKVAPIGKVWDSKDLRGMIETCAETILDHAIGASSRLTQLDIDMKDTTRKPGRIEPSFPSTRSIAPKVGEILTGLENMQIPSRNDGGHDAGRAAL